MSSRRIALQTNYRNFAIVAERQFPAFGRPCRFLLWEHKFSASATQNGKGAYAIQQVMSNGCLEYEAMCSSAERASSSQRCSGADATVAVSAYPLNPHMFLPRPHVQRLGLPRRIIHRPFWVRRFRLSGVTSAPLSPPCDKYVLCCHLLWHKMLHKTFSGVLSELEFICFPLISLFRPRICSGMPTGPPTFLRSSKP